MDASQAPIKLFECLRRCTKRNKCLRRCTKSKADAPQEILALRRECVHLLQPSLFQYPLQQLRIRPCLDAVREWGEGRGREREIETKGDDEEKEALGTLAETTDLANIGEVFLVSCAQQQHDEALKEFQLFRPL